MGRVIDVFVNKILFSSVKFFNTRGIFILYTFDYNLQDSSTPSNCGRSTCLNQIYGVADLVSLPINTSSIDVTLHQQEQLKVILFNTNVNQY